ncbi:hypothetical protein [Oerskovia flava]|uniref:hypothetical protein n=1 Tax=Oerskovia flava TaxID=2986422 RepID=UPI002240D87F|nr:hypothetical protein [Oerskovia sp. JB1-3-2]
MPRPDDHPDPPAHDAWEQIVARFARFSGLVGEVDDPLTWGLDLDEETVTGTSTGDHDPSDERFLRSYVSYLGETLDIETLRVRPDDEEQAADIVRAALSGALAAPLHSDVADEEDLLDSYQEYRAAMRAIVTEVDAAELTTEPYTVDGVARPALQVRVRETAAAYVPLADRAIVIAGPSSLLDRVDVITRPIRNLLHGEDGPRF